MATLDFTTKPLALDFLKNIHIHIFTITNLLPFKYSSPTFQSLDILVFSPTQYLCDTEEPDIPTWIFIYIYIYRERERERYRNHIDATYHPLGWISSPLDNSNCVGFSQRSISFGDALLGVSLFLRIQNRYIGTSFYINHC